MHGVAENKAKYKKAPAKKARVDEPNGELFG
jgi:hypothetical protein